MNPKAACLKRREEEKADDGSAKGMQGPPHLGGGGGAGGGGPPPMIPFGSMPSSVSYWRKETQILSNSLLTFCYFIF